METFLAERCCYSIFWGEGVKDKFSGIQLIYAEEFTQL